MNKSKKVFSTGHVDAAAHPFITNNALRQHRRAEERRLLGDERRCIPALQSGQP